MTPQTAILFAFSLILPAIAQMRFGTPLALGLAMAGCYALTSAVFWSAFSLGFGATVLNLAVPGGGAYHDTYYVVSEGSHVFRLSAFFLLLSLALWAEGRFGRMRRKIGLTLCLWGIHVSVLLNTLLLSAFARVGMPRLYVDYPEYFDRMTRVSDYASATLGTLCAVLAGIILWLLSLRLRRS